MRNTPDSNDELLNIHERLLDSDPTATYDMFQIAASALERYLRFKFPSIATSVDPDIYLSAAHDALTDYFKNPHRYDRDKRGLMGYLRMLAYRDMQNLIRKESRHAAGRVSLDDVEFSASDGNDTSETVADRMDARRIQYELARDMNSQELAVFDLIIQGERSTEAAACALGISHLPLSQQKREVKRIKDRITRRIRRRGVPFS